MKRLIILLLIPFFHFGQSNPTVKDVFRQIKQEIRGNSFPSGSSITDIDGNNYQTVNIGGQQWTSSNLQVTKFKNGELIPQAVTKDDWILAGINKRPAWCYLFFDSKYGQKFGKLYNWYAVTDKRGLAPDGWEIPSTSSFTDIKKSIPNPRNWSEGCYLKSKNGWYTSNNGYNDHTNGIDYFGFCALPGSYHSKMGENTDYKFVNNEFRPIGCYFWTQSGVDVYGTKTEANGVVIENRRENICDSDIAIKQFNLSCGLSVRLIKSSEASSTSTSTANTSNIISYSQVQIGNQVWIKENINEVKFRNGDPITEALSMEEWYNLTKSGKPAFVRNISLLNQSNLRLGNTEVNSPPLALYCNKVDCGLIYNWYAVNDPRGLAPLGWHIATRDEWDYMIKYYESKTGSKYIGDAAKEDGFLGNTWWTASRTQGATSTNSYYKQMFRNPNQPYFIIEGQVERSYGLYVRCIKD